MHLRKREGKSNLRRQKKTEEKHGIGVCSRRKRFQILFHNIERHLPFSVVFILSVKAQCELVFCILCND